MPPQPNRSMAFGPFVVDGAARLLLRDGRVVRLPPRAFEVLLLLLDRAGEIITTDEIIDHVWKDKFVEENNLAQAIRAIRHSLADTSGSRAYLQTIAGRGYRFVLPTGANAWESTPPALAPPSDRNERPPEIVVGAFTWLGLATTSSPPRSGPASRARC